MKRTLSAYVLCFNNRAMILEAIRSLEAQTERPAQIFVIDDGSTDGSYEMLRAEGVQVFRQDQNLGRGAARARAMKEACNELVLCCDATNVLPPNFVQQALPWFDDASVAGVFGLITDPSPVGAISRWRARHLFKADAVYAATHHQVLITFGAVVRASAVAAVGGYAAQLRHNEDNDLGYRLLAGGYDVVGDPALEVRVNTRNTLSQVLERYWRWYAGKDEHFSTKAYLRSIMYSIRGMAWQDIKAGDPLAACISLLVPHYQLWRRIRLAPKRVLWLGDKHL